ncbi:MAG: Jag N-terminal domain-containing protein [Chloroflexia bacterium]|jgi:spoIIIJ-associated protein|nr:Jag N-terminal domain-containing protein [Chloroflexia bacterium]
MDSTRRTSVEIQAYSVEEAVRLALEQLALSPDEVDIEILSDAGPDEDAEALVRVTAKGMASQPIPSGGGTSGAPRRPLGPRRAPGDRPSGRGMLSDRPSGRGMLSDRPSSRGIPPRHPAADRIDAEDEQVAKVVVRELLERMGVRADVMAVDNPSAVSLDGDDPPTIFVDILGRDLGMLIGRRGDNLVQLQYLVNLLINRRLETWTRVILDVEGYRSRREESLVGLAERVANQVARSRRPIQLEPMPPNERRIVHITLKSNPEVTTESTGEGGMRRVTVQPRA